MNLKQLSARALQIREKYSVLDIQATGQDRTKEQIMEGFVVDVGDLMRLVMAKSGLRQIEDLDNKLAHELSDCLWCVLVLANKYNVDLESVFLKNMDELDAKINLQIKS